MQLSCAVLSGADATLQKSRKHTLSSSKKFRTDQPESRQLRQLLIEYGADHGLDCDSDLLTCVNTACLPVQRPWFKGRRRLPVATVRATGSFQGRPWFSTVKVDIGGGQTSYAELRMLFKTRPVGQDTDELLCLVRWMQKVSQAGNSLKKFGCERVAYEPHPLHAGGWYQVISARSILSPEACFLDYEKPGCFVISSFTCERGEYRRAMLEDDNQELLDDEELDLETDQDTDDDVE